MSLQVYQLSDGSRAAPLCCRCKTTVDRLTEIQDVISRQVIITAHCHGGKESVRIDFEDAYTRGCRQLITLPTSFFWPGYSAYRTTTKPKRRKL